MQGVLLGMPLAVALSGLIAGLVIWALARWPLWPRRKSVARSRAGRSGTNFFLFRHGLLIDHDTGPADRPGVPLTGVTEWPDLRGWLDPRFPGLPTNLPPLFPGQITTHPAEDPADPAVITSTAARRVARRPHPPRRQAPSPQGRRNRSHRHLHPRPRRQHRLAQCSLSGLFRRRGNPPPACRRPSRRNRRRPGRPDRPRHRPNPPHRPHPHRGRQSAHPLRRRRHRPRQHRRHAQ